MLDRDQEFALPAGEEPLAQTGPTRGQLGRLLPLVALLFVAACTSQRSAPRHAPPAATAKQQLALRQAGLNPSPPQQPSDPPLLVATQPDLPPADAPLAAVSVAVPAALNGAYPDGRTLNLPAGFQASVYALPGGGPRFMALSPDGRVFVALISSGQVVELADDGGGAATAQTVIDGLNAPSSLSFFGGYLYVGEINEIVRYPYTDGSVETSQKQVVVPNLPGGGHSTLTVDFGPDGLMYVAVGSSCNVCVERNPLRAAITVYQPDGSAGRTYASGLRNAVGFTWQPGTGDLWATVNGRDNIGDDMGLSGAAATQATDNLPPDYLTRITDGGNYGWPRCYGDHQLDPKFGDAAFCATTLVPSVEIQAHSAPLGLAFYRGTAFPQPYQGDLFVALHGSWNRSVPTGYKLVRLHFENGQPAAVIDFATGFLTGGQAWFRPVGILELPDGSLLVSDDQGGAILRISYGP
ncbi:MAG TPA: PQQ-dependent sugar dehydrogenase [Dehalococcoidia bacterium]|nr:PQQ-dependent sugar dehydrogenase [Dehalococcoidia bacterium]